MSPCAKNHLTRVYALIPFFKGAYLLPRVSTYTTNHGLCQIVARLFHVLAPFGAVLVLSSRTTCCYALVNMATLASHPRSTNQGQSPTVPFPLKYDIVYQGNYGHHLMMFDDYNTFNNGCWITIFSCQRSPRLRWFKSGRAICKAMSHTRAVP